MKKITMDFETRSTQDLTKLGRYAYARHKNTEVLCLSIRDAATQAASLWVPDCMGGNKPPDIMKRALDGPSYFFEAHNAEFEMAIYFFKMVQMYGWPEIPLERWRCSRASASVYALPPSLGMLSKVLELDEKKDGGGRKIMMELCKPLAVRNSTTDDIFRRPIYSVDDAKYKKLYAYCEQDTLTEEHVSDVVGQLSEYDLRVWQQIVSINTRGVYCNVEAVKGALSIVNKLRINSELQLQKITAGAVDRPTQGVRIQRWAESRGCRLGASMDKDAVGRYIARLEASGEHPEVLEVLNIKKDMSKSSLAKLDNMALLADPDDQRIRDLLIFNGAARTGRLTGALLQIQNFPRGLIKDFSDAQRIVHYLKNEDLAAIESYQFSDTKGGFYTLPPMHSISSVLRLLLCAEPGKRLITADYSGIEARVLPWLAGDFDKLNRIQTGVDLYLDAADKIFGKKGHTKADKFQRAVGKEQVLAGGYGMGWVLFGNRCRLFKIDLSPLISEALCPVCGRKVTAETRYYAGLRMNIAGDTYYKFYVIHKDGCADEFLNKNTADDDNVRRVVKKEAKLVHLDCTAFNISAAHIIDNYRENNPLIVSWWAELNNAARSTIEGKIPEMGCRSVTFRWEDPHLSMELPSKRRIYYPWAEIRKDEITYMGQHPQTKKWVRMKMYGGKFAGHATQGAANDVLRFCMLNVEEKGYPLVLSLHDEAVAEVPKDFGSLEEFCEIMETKPSWAEDLPLTVEGWQGVEFRKG